MILRPRKNILNKTIDLWNHPTYMKVMYNFLKTQASYGEINIHTRNIENIRKLFSGVSKDNTIDLSRDDMDILGISINELYTYRNSLILRGMFEDSDLIISLYEGRGKEYMVNPNVYTRSENTYDEVVALKQTWNKYKLYKARREQNISDRYDELLNRTIAAAGLNMMDRKRLLKDEWLVNEMHNLLIIGEVVLKDRKRLHRDYIRGNRHIIPARVTNGNRSSIDTFMSI